MKAVFTANMRYVFEHDTDELINVSGGQRIKIAGLVREINRNYQFIETIYVNRGFNVRLFTDEEDAMSWLIKTT